MKVSQFRQTDSDFFENLIETTIQGCMGEVLEQLLNHIMLLQRDQFLGALPYERTDTRNGYANGFKPLTLKTAEGKLKVAVPQVRNSQTPFKPSVLDCATRSEKALRVAIGEMYVNGVSTRKVTKIVENLWPEGLSSGTVSNIAKELDFDLEQFRNRKLDSSYKYVWLDAMYEKVRLEGTVQSMAVLVAIGINSKGYREVIGISAKISEAETHWRSFLESLLERGLKGVDLIISDDHVGLKNARKAVFSHVMWQRCFFHLQQNAQSKINKMDQRIEIANDMRSIFNQTSSADAEAKLNTVVRKWESINPKFSDWVDQACREAFSFYKYPSEHWRKIKTTNPLERLNKEIRRRTRVAGIFPSEGSCMRLISAILVEQHETWAEKCYIKPAN